MTDIDAARTFVALHARLVDRRRFDHLIDGGSPEPVVAAVGAYANPDGGFAGVIEPDVRTTTSQPIGVLTAFEILHEAGAPAPRAALDWLASLARDGGVPFSLTSVRDAPHAPWMAPSEAPSLHMTAALAAAALRLGAQHAWVDAACDFCRARIPDVDGSAAYELKYALEFLDAAGDAEGIERLRPLIPADGRLPVRGGIEGEALAVLDLAPRPGLARRLFTAEQLEAARAELAAGQRDDGGWDVDFLEWSPLVALEWRGRRTVDALARLAAG